MPFALRIGGWVVLLMIVLAGLISLYTSRLLVASLHFRGDGKRVPSWPALGYAAFGGAGRVCLHVFQKVTLLGIATLYFILAGIFLLEATADSLPLLGVLCSQRHALCMCLWATSLFLKKCRRALCPFPLHLMLHPDSYISERAQAVQNFKPRRLPTVVAVCAKVQRGWQPAWIPEAMHESFAVSQALRSTVPQKGE